MLRSVNLSGPAGRLEALLNEGAGDAPFAALVCHPHPLGGGTFHNKVVYHAMKVLNDPERGLGWPVLRFNFRGVGLSEGVHDGEAESDDVLAAIEWLENEYKLPLVVVGFSFGAAMAVKACCGPGTSGTAEKLAISGVTGVKHPSGAKAQGDCVGFMRGLKPPPPSESSFSATCSGSIGANVGALALLGLPTQADGRHFHYAFLRDCIIPKLFLSGDCDSFAPGAQLERVAAAAAEPKRLVLIPRADHFFTGQLEPMQHALSTWLKEQRL
jgi:alpha/beta superfamily hydrolase